MKILLIEDQPKEIQSIGEMFFKMENSGFELESSRSMKDGLQRLSEGGIDLVLLDLTLPDCEGSEAFIRVQSQVPDVPVVILIGLEDEELGLQIVRRGAQDFLIKGTFNHELLTRSMTYAMERNQFRKSLDEIANTDPLTELLNRRGLQQVLSTQVAWARRGVETVAVLIDIDEFTKINDTLGHAVGDVVLKEVSARLKTNLRVTDFLARLGSDEFMILLPQTRIAEALLVSEKLRKAVSQFPLVISGATIKITISSGLASVCPETPSIDELLAKTYVALRKSRHSGDKVIYSTSPFVEGPKKEFLLADVLDMLKDRESFHVVKQPIKSIYDGQTVGYEFLSRFKMKDFENPDDFFRMCMENNMLALVDHYCFMNCIHAWEDMPQSLRYHFNIFPATLMDIDAYNLLEDLPETYQKGSACIEISEQQIIGDPSLLSKSIEVFRNSGVLIGMDDIGFGKSSLESLIILNPDVVKIDKRCIIGIGQDAARQRSLERLVKVLNNLEVETVAEGIETEEDLRIVQDFGIKCGQGYLWGKPA
ncbi:MAG: EAL domain-containing protein [Candidatus Omnitrophica bacterium]|nr:EAL domain-containing protein [Candidatus Omnitrophota bacterium]